jgi:hypothetical protein
MYDGDMVTIPFLGCWARRTLIGIRKCILSERMLSTWRARVAAQPGTGRVNPIQWVLFYLKKMAC